MTDQTSATAALSPAVQRALIDARLRSDLTAFICRAFETIAPGEHLAFNWHIKAIAHALERVMQGRTTRLIIAMPPRHLKSISVSVAFPAFLLGQDPSRKIIAASYSDILATKHHNDCRVIMSSSWYRRVFPESRMAVGKNTETEFMTTRRGGRFATSVGGTLTGRGGNLIIIDDPMKPDEAASESARRRVAQWFDTTLLSRLDNKSEDAIIIVMQRLHIDDLAGVMLQKGGWELLELQAIAETDQTIPIGSSRTFRRKAGSVLHPARESRASLEALKLSMGSFDFSAQYQQRPIPLEGNMIRRNWLKTYEAVPADRSGDSIVISWDTANKASELANYSVGTAWLVQGEQVYLLDLVRDRFAFPDLKRAVLAFRDRWPSATNLIEDKGSGISLIQELRADGVPVISINPEADKITRLYAVQPLFEAGSVFLPRQAAWLPGLLEELLAFPNYRSDDQVDSISQALNWIRRRRQAAIPVVSPYSIPNEIGITLGSRW